MFSYFFTPEEAPKSKPQESSSDDAAYYFRHLPPAQIRTVLQNFDSELVGLR